MTGQSPLIDYHTQVIEHGLAKPRRVAEIVQSAVAQGLSTICLTDHYPLPPNYVDPTAEQDCAMPLAAYPDYQLEVDAAIDEFSSAIAVRRGAEVDWLPEHIAWTTGQLQVWPFDYVIGSVHLLGQIGGGSESRNFILDYKEEEFLEGIAWFGGIRRLIEEYFRQIRSLVESDLFDGVGHLDLIKKFNDGSLFDEREDWYRSAVFETLDTISQSRMTVEINASGLLKKCREVYPSPWIVSELYKRGIAVTIGSDGHTPETIGKNLDKASLVARAAGYERLAEYQARSRSFLTL